MKTNINITFITTIMHTINLEGGLGNQLFMIFAALGHAFKYKTTVYFEDVQIQTGSRKKTYWHSFLKPLQPYCTPPITNTYVYREPSFHYTEIPPFPHDIRVKMVGYYQSYKYFDAYRDEIFKLLEIETRKKEVERKLNAKQIDWSKTVSMHFRIGDYKTLPQYHPVLPVEYYKNALSMLRYSNKAWKVLYFCEDEDIAEVSKKVNELKNEFPTMKFERMENAGLDDWEEILAMSLCRHHIIANSSFSYFGAYFDTKPDVNVYYPSVWFGPALADKNTQDMCPPNWIQVVI